MIKGYYFITDEKCSVNGNQSDVEQAVAGGARIVQYRNDMAPLREVLEEAQGLIRLCTNTLFIINNRVDVALAVDADGVHIGQDDLPLATARRILGKKKIIGVTVHTLEEALAAQKGDASYVAVSPIFSTKTKKDAGKPVGLKLLSIVKDAVSIPVVAIGGITIDNVPEVIAAGADAVCAISAVVAHKDVKARVNQFQELFSKKRR